jgi:hypothetical protein
MGGLKEYIKHELFLKHPANIMDTMQFTRHIQAKNKATHNPTIGAYVESRERFGIHKTIVPQLKRLTPQQMDERRAKGLCFNCDNKYSEGHNCGEKKLFYIDYEEEEYQELELSHDPDLEDTTPMISVSCIGRHQYSTNPQDMRYIKKKKVTILIDSSSICYPPD